MENFNLTLGDVVRIGDDAPVCGGLRAYVYETYPDYDIEGENGVSLITEDGADTGGWSKKEQRRFLEYIEHSGWDYQYENVIKLGQDFRAGVFDRVFKK